MRKALIYLFCCGVVAVAVACSGVDAATDPQTTDGPHPMGPALARQADAGAPAIARRLDRVANILARANRRLDAINADFQDPPEPDKPAIRAALDGVRAEALRLIATVDAIQAKIP